MSAHQGRMRKARAEESRPVRVAFVITGLGRGGAEFMLYKLLTRLDPQRFSPEVVVLTKEAALLDAFNSLGVPVTILGMPRTIPDPRILAALVRHLRRSRPHIVQSWMYHADLAAGVAARFAGNIPVLWNIRNSTLPRGAAKPGTIAAMKMGAVLSRWLPDRIVCCAEASRSVHTRAGYDARKFVVIPNGFNMEQFSPNAEHRTAIRHELGVEVHEVLIGNIARFHPQKDQQNFVRGAGSVARRNPDARFLMCGDGIHWDNQELKGWIEATGFRDRFLLLGSRTDVTAITAALDIAVSASCSEGFPNVVGEAMSSGVPCVVTDVGDSAYLLGGAGIVVPPKHPEELAGGLERLLQMSPLERETLGAQGRRRIDRHFSIESITLQYESVFEDVVHRRGRLR